MVHTPPYLKNQKVSHHQARGCPITFMYFWPQISLIQKKNAKFLKGIIFSPLIDKTQLVLTKNPKICEISHSFKPGLGLE